MKLSSNATALCLRIQVIDKALLKLKKSNPRLELSTEALFSKKAVMKSGMKYPYYAFKTETIHVPPYRITTGKDSFRAITIIGMPDVVGNFALGYDVGGFSGRISAYSKVQQ